MTNPKPQNDVRRKPGRPKKKQKKIRVPDKRQETFVNTYLETGNKALALDKAGYAPGTRPENIQVVQDALAERQKEMMKRFMDNADEMKENMLDLARNAKSESVKFQATKDMLDRAGLNPINKNQTESAKYVSIESRFSRGALERYERELEAKNGQKNKAGE